MGAEDRSSTPVYYVNTNGRYKRDRPGNEASTSTLSACFTSNWDNTMQTWLLRKEGLCSWPMQLKQLLAERNSLSKQLTASKLDISKLEGKLQVCVLSWVSFPSNFTIGVKNMQLIYMRATWSTRTMVTIPVSWCVKMVALLSLLGLEC